MQEIIKKYEALIITKDGQLENIQKSIDQIRDNPNFSIKLSELRVERIINVAQKKAYIMALEDLKSIAQSSKDEELVGKIMFFKTTDSGLQKFNNKPVKIIGVISEPDDMHDEEVLPMYILNISKDRKYIEAFKDELHPIEMSSDG